MNKRQSMILGLAAAAVLGGTRAHAQATVSYSAGDLLLNFREATFSGSDMEVDLGNVVNFVDSHAGGSVVVFSASGMADNFEEFDPYSATNPGKNTFGGGQVGMTASAETTGGTVFLTRSVTGAGVIGTASGQQAIGPQQGTANIIDAVGQAAASTQYGTALASAADLVAADVKGASLVSKSATGSFESLAEISGNPPINFNGNQSTAAGVGGSLEILADSGAHGFAATTGYAALWDVPVSGSGSDQYLGYFTFQPSGEVDYNGVNAVPEPSTYAMFAGAGLLALVFRRKLTSATA